jgi:RNA polymerase sigma-70 factor (ECF subfamily)
MTLEALLPRTESSQAAQPELVARLRSGELAAVGEAYDLHHEQVRRFARRLLGDESAAEDLVQETFLTLPRAVKRFEGRSTLRTFLISIAANHSRHHVRGAARRRKAMDKAGQESVPPGHSTQASNPEQELARRQMAALLNRCLDQLSHDHRLTFVLCEVEDYTSSKAAEVLGVPEGTVRTRLMHAKKNLRTLLEKEGATPSGRSAS